VEIEEEAYGKEYIELATTLNNQGDALMSLGEYSNALERYERALAIKKSAYGENHPS